MQFSSNPNCRHAPSRSRAEASGYRLTANDASIAKAMLARGDRQHDVAAYFGVNPGRIAEIATGEKFASVTLAHVKQLPPPGPYPRPCDAIAAREALALARAALDHAEQLIFRVDG